jgi:hypothetical protein
MSEDKVIHLRIKSAEEMGVLGGAFGAHFLHPLMTGDDPRASQPVVSFYGIKGVGKTTFIKGMGKVFPPIPQWIETIPSEDRCRKISIRVRSEAGQKFLYRFKDFGRNNYLGENGSMWEQGGMRPRAFGTLRTFLWPLGPGFDCLEHPPVPHLKGSHLVVIMSTDYYPGYTHAYFEHKISALSRQRDLVPSVKNAMLGLMARLATQKAQDRREVIFLLTTENPAMQLAFDDFRKNTQQNFEPYKSCAVAGLT